MNIPVATAHGRASVLPIAAARAGLLLCLALVPTLATAAGTSDTWFTVLLDGRKVGHAHFSRSAAEDHITTRQDVHLEVNRAGQALTIDTREQDRETAAGAPLGFRSATRLAGSTTRLVGQRLADGRFEVTRSVGGATHTETVGVPAGALLAEGQRLAVQQARRQPGTTVEFIAWDVAAGSTYRVLSRMQGMQQASLPGGAETLLRVDQHAALGTGGIDTSLWLDADFRIRRLRTGMLGMTLELLACNKACALAPNQGVDILDRAMVALPHALTRAERRGPLLYTLRAVGEAPLHVTATDQQQVVALGNGRWQVRVDNTPQARQAPPLPADSAANDWLQADDPALRKLARTAVGGAIDPAARMAALEHFVARYVTTKSLAVGYASALEVMRQREGDCTEHAVLLAALARALDIPARVVSGLVYASSYNGHSHVLVPHAWVEAWVDGHWRGFDAAQRGFNSGHVALETGDGDPWHFFNTVNTLGRIEVTAVHAAVPNAAPAGAAADP